MPSLSAATCHAFEGKKLAACFLSFHPVNGTTGAQTACPVTHPVARPRDHQALPQKSAGFVHIKSYESSSQPPLSLLLTLLLDLPIVPLAWPIAVMMIFENIFHRDHTTSYNHRTDSKIGGGFF